jgi:hypothetical protein
VCDTEDEARKALALHPDLMFQEFIDTPEVSVDAFTRRDGESTVMVQRVRDRVVGGESWRSHTIRDAGVGELARATSRALSDRGFSGPVNIQVFQADPPILVEVNTRLGSASVFSDFATEGRLFRSVLADACGLYVDGSPDDYLTGVFLYRYLGDLYYDGSSLLGGAPGPSDTSS